MTRLRTHRVIRRERLVVGNDLDIDLGHISPVTAVPQGPCRSVSHAAHLQNSSYAPERTQEVRNERIDVRNRDAPAKKIELIWRRDDQMRSRRAFGNSKLTVRCERWRRMNRGPGAFLRYWGAVRRRCRDLRASFADTTQTPQERYTCCNGRDHSLVQT